MVTVEPTLLIGFIGILLGLYLIGVPVAFAMGLTGLILMFMGQIPLSFELIAQGTLTGIDSFVLLAIPLYLMTGMYMNMFGVTSVIFKFAKAIVGPIRGGLAHVNIFASILFSGMTGAAVADAAGLGLIEFTAMQEEGYEEGFSVSITGASSIIGPIIPPSIPLIIYGILAETSIGALFLAGIIPGLIMAVLLLIVATFYAHKHGYEKGPMWSASRMWSTFKEAAPALGVIAIIIGGLLGGLFTATEAGAAALFYTIFIGYAFYGGTPRDTLVQTTYDGFVTTAALTFIIGVASFYGFLVRRSQIPRALGNMIGQITADPLIILFLIVGVLLLVGLMMETVAAITILTPIFLPIIEGFGMDPVYFGVIMVLTLMIGLLTPPFGIVLFVLERVTKVPLETIMKSIVPFYVPLLAVLLLVILFEDLTLYIPRLVGLG
jgi:tripartite ATP-independent transporter DctM subunit